MTWWLLFTDLNGRIPRSRFWIGTAVLLAVTVIAFFALVMLGMGVTRSVSGTVTLDSGESSPFRNVHIVLTPTGRLILNLVILFPMVAVFLKRCHDRGSQGYFLILVVVIGLLLRILGLTGSETIDWVVHVLDVVVWFAFLYFLIVLGFLKGDVGANAYGPDPLASDSGK
jgi:uncharacterized membrane protein YhaH (DUF805 family)